MAVQRHALHAELGTQLVHGQRRQAVGVDELQRRPQHLLPGQPGARGAVRGTCHHGAARECGVSRHRRAAARRARGGAGRARPWGHGSLPVSLSVASLRHMDYLSSEAYVIRTSTKGGAGMLGDQRADGRGGARPAIELSGLTKQYRRGKDWHTAVDDVTLTVPAGQVIGLLGPNGAGKTTTIKMACGLILPTAGTIRINGYDIGRQRANAVRQIGAVLEGSRNVYWPLTAWQNLMYFGRLKGLRGQEIRPRAERLLTGLGLWERRNESVGSYSRGMQQKVAIAAALITDPPILLLDEPTIGLDVQTARTVKDWIARLVHEEGKTIVLTTHQLALAQELCDRIAIIHRGRLLTDLPVRELLARFRQETYEIRLGGSLASSTFPWLDGFSVTSEDSESLIRGPIPDQERLYDLLAQLRAQHLPLIAVEPVEPNLEDVFVQILKER